MWAANDIQLVLLAQLPLAGGLGQLTGGGGRWHWTRAAVYGEVGLDNSRCRSAPRADSPRAHSVFFSQQPVTGDAQDAAAAAETCLRLSRTGFWSPHHGGYFWSLVRRPEARWSPNTSRSDAVLYGLSAYHQPADAV